MRFERHALLGLCLVSSLWLMAGDPVSLLSEEILRTVEERDRARKELLQSQNRSEQAIQALRQARKDLSRRLDAKSRQLLDIEADAHLAREAEAEAQQRLSTQTNALQKIQRERDQLERNYQRVAKELEQTAAQGGSTADVVDLRREKEALALQVDQKTQELAAQTDAMELLQAAQTELNRQNERLSEELDIARRDAALSNAKLDALESRLGALRNELTGQFEERSRMEQENEDLQSRIQDLEADLKLAEENSVPLQKMMDLRKELEQAELENRDLRQQLADARSVPDLREDFAKVQRERDLLSDQRKKLNSQLKRTEKSLRREQETAKDLEEKNRKLEERLQAERKHSKELQKDIRALKAGVRAASDSGVDPEELVEVKRLLEDMEEENLRLRTMTENQQSTVDGLMEELYQEQTERKRSLRELQGMLGDQLRQLAEAEKKLHVLEHTENELVEVKAQRYHLLEHQKKTRQDMKTLANHIYSLRRQLNTERGATEQLQRERVRVQTLNQTLTDVRRSMDDQKREMATLHQSANRQTAKMKQVEEQLRRQDQRSQQLEEENRRLRLLLQKGMPVVEAP